MNPHGILKGAIIGFGNMAENGHLTGWQRRKDTVIKALVEPRPERRERARGRIDNIHIYARIDELLEKEDLDFVDICTPPPYHAPLTIQCLRHKLHVLCEKPFVSTMKDYRRIKALVEKEQRTAFPVHNWKHAPILAEAIRRISSGAIGSVIHSEFHTLRAQPAEGLTSWRDTADESGGGGILMDHGWHGLYILFALNQQEPIAVTAWMQPPVTSGTAERSVHLFLEFEHSTASMYLTWEAPQRYNSARVYGTKGIICIEDALFSLTTIDGNKETLPFPKPLSLGSHHPDWFDAVIQEFLYEIFNPDARGKSLEEVRACVQCTHMAYASTAKGSKRVPFSEK